MADIVDRLYALINGLLFDHQVSNFVVNIDKLPVVFH
jgi:hypothetical protein